ncbi:MAG: oligosaccharide flippase family protein, partial [Candidatus Bathyarchaeota archaeon]
MSEELDLAKTVMRGAIHLLSGKLVSKLIGVGGSILLLILLGSEGLGDLTIAMNAPAIFNTVFNVGIGVALTKLLAEYQTQGKFGVLKGYLWTGLRFTLGLSVGLTVLCFLAADFYATHLLLKPSLAPVIRVASLLIVARMTYTIAEAILIGLDATKEYALIMILM